MGSVKQRWLDVLIILVSLPVLVPDLFSAARTVRVFRLVRLVTAIAVGAIGVSSGRKVLAQVRLLFVGTTGLITVCAGALAVFVAEAGTNSAFKSLTDAFWWAGVTATTVGYGALSPVTWEGRAIALCLMLVGIGIIGVFTATVASAFLHAEQSAQQDALAARLDAIGAKLDLLLEERPERHEARPRRVVGRQ